MRKQYKHLYSFTTDKTKTSSNKKDKATVRKTKNSAKAGKQLPLTTNSLRGVAFGASTSRGRSYLPPALRKRINHAENQLANKAIIENIKEPIENIASQSLRNDESETDETAIAAIANLLTENVETNEQPEESISVVKMTGNNKTMVTPHTRDAPKFSARRPEELRRFLRQMEDLWKDAGIDDDQTKKVSLGKYADGDSEEEWAAFAAYEEGHTWAEFKEELYKNYPEAAEAERGTPQRLRQVCNETREISLGDMLALFAFRRKFMTEAKKLAVAPAAMSNREMVELFTRQLSKQMRSLVLQHLANRASQPEIKAEVPEPRGEGTTAKSIKVLRRPEDHYDLEEVCEAAVSVSENQQGIFQ